jgi:prepilin-type N-terminal cleavage/methylation domain-containing protein
MSITRTMNMTSAARLWSRRRALLRGFTLIEVLVAITLLLALSGALSAMLFGLMERRDRVAIEASRQGAVDILFSEIDAALVGAFVDGPHGAGIRGDGTSLRILSRGVRVAPGNGLSDVIGLEFRFEESQRGIIARRLAPGASVPSAMEPAASEIARVRVRYLDERGWKSSFDSSAMGRLPAAIEVSIWFADGAEEEPAPGGLLADEPDSSSDAAMDRADASAGADGDEEDAGPPPSRRRVMVVPDGPSIGQSIGVSESGGAL